jgi:hypothetical protein
MMGACGSINPGCCGIQLRHVIRIVVTAERSAMQHAPTMPEVAVLDSAMKGM